MSPRPDYTHEHTSHCEATTIAQSRRFTPAARCVICKTWWAGYAAALQSVQPIITDEFEAGHAEGCTALNCPGCEAPSE